ncbi:MAG TPA: hypothetical protein VK324_06685 [Tepidisphaeraceae bacterium]|nr:hypothetical protein [Tepidisphaeraceae bacterium]
MNMDGLTWSDVERAVAAREQLIASGHVRLAPPLYRRRWWARAVKVGEAGQVLDCRGPAPARIGRMNVMQVRPYWWGWPLELLWRVDPRLSFAAGVMLAFAAFVVACFALSSWMITVLPR